MTSSGTYAFQPSLGEAVVYAFHRCGVRPTALTQEHMQDARMASNMVLADFSNRGVNLWKVELVTVPLVQGTATYSIDASIVVMLDAYISTSDAITTTTTDRLILPVSRSEYAAFPNKGNQGLVTVYWQDRLLEPSVTLYYVPDGTQPYLKFYAVQQIQDANYTAGQTVDIPYLWQKAFVSALAAELAVAWAPERLTMLKGLADEAYGVAADQNVETSQFYLSPTLSGYFRA